MAMLEHNSLFFLAQQVYGEQLASRGGKGGREDTSAGHAMTAAIPPETTPTSRRLQISISRYFAT